MKTLVMSSIKPADPPHSLAGMLDIDPLIRVSIEDVVRHPWLCSHQAHDLTIPLHTWDFDITNKNRLVSPPLAS